MFHGNPERRSLEINYEMELEGFRSRWPIWLSALDTLSHNKQRQTLGIIKIKVLGFFVPLFLPTCAAAVVIGIFPEIQQK